MEKLTVTLCASSLNPVSVMELYDQLLGLPVPLFVGQRMKLPCLVFKLGTAKATLNGLERVFRAQTDTLGIVEIRTKEDLSQFNRLYLVHPWLDFLLDRHRVGSTIETVAEENTDDPSSSLGEPPSFAGPSNAPGTASEKRTARFAFLFGRRTAARREDAGSLHPPLSVSSLRPPSSESSLHPPSSVSPEDRVIQAFQVVARLSQPFGALLLTPDTGKIAAYRRVAAETLITVQVEEITPAVLNKLISNVRILDVL